jgi:putative transposase
MNKIIEEYGAIPERIQVDNGSEFISKDFDRWAFKNNVIIYYSRPGRPKNNPFIVSFKGSLRDECLNTNWFLSLQDAKYKIESWRGDYDEYRSYSSLQGITLNQVNSEKAKYSEIYILEVS